MVITGDRALVDPRSLGLTFEAIVFVTMSAADRATVDAFERAVTDVPEVVQAQRQFGDPDYSSASWPGTCPPTSSSTIASSPPCQALQRPRSTLVMTSVVEDRPLLP